MQQARSKRLRSRGIVLLMSLLTMTIAATFIMYGLTRSMTELQAAQRVAARQQAFHLAEAGLVDELFRRQGSWAVQQIQDTLIAPAAQTYSMPGGTSYTVDYVDYNADNNLTDRIVRLVSTGTVPFNSGMAIQTLTATIQLFVTQPTGFEYAVAGAGANMDGGATIGTIADQVALYIDAENPGPWAGSQGNLLAGQANDVWATTINFYNPNNRALAAICPKCDNASIFHGPPIFNMNAQQLAPVQIALKPYYDEAKREIEQELSLAPGTYDPAVHTSYHHIKTDTTLRGDTNPATIDYSGVIYVECGVALQLQGDKRNAGIQLAAVIVHEGCDRKIFTAPNTGLTIYENAFAPGLAIIGAPWFDFSGTAEFNISGFIMGTGDMAASGTVTGGVIAIGTTAVAKSGSSPFPGQQKDFWGPGTDAYITWYPGTIHLGGQSNIIFKMLGGSLPGFPTSGSGGGSGGESSQDPRPKVLCWGM
jgi:hypothetical protein